MLSHEKKYHVLIFALIGIALLFSGTKLFQLKNSITSKEEIAAATSCTYNFTIQGAPPYTFTPSCVQNNSTIYANEPRFTFFQVPTAFQNMPYIQTTNVGIKEDQSLSWKINVTTPSTMYIFYRKIPGQQAPDWIQKSYQKQTNDDYTNLTQFIMRKNEQGLIGLYDIYRSNNENFQGTAEMGPASTTTTTAYSMYLVAIKENVQNTIPSASPRVISAFGDAGINPNAQANINLSVQEKSDGLIYLGDMDYGAGATAWKTEFAPLISSKTPTGTTVYDKCFCVQGNHEPNFDQYKDVYPNGQPYWSTVINGARLIGINTELSLQTNSAQYIWLDKELAQSRESTKLVVMHKPWWVAQPATEDIVQGNPTQLDALMAKYNVTMVLAGHKHNYHRKVRNGNKPYVIIGTGGDSILPLSSVDNTTAKTYLGYGYVLLSITSTQISGKFIAINGTQIDSFSSSSPSTTPSAAPSSTPVVGAVDASSMDKKFMLGYQGWFQCPADGSPSATWRHWFSGTPPNSPLIDAWPDTSELSAAERCDTGLKLPNGQPAYLYSAYNQQTVLRHFQWMKQYGIDGIMLQRFTSELSIPAMFATRNKVASNVRLGAEQSGRVFNIMYDISGQNSQTLVTTIENDWKYLVDTQKITESPRYLKQNGRPLVVIWGFGFADRPGTPSDLTALLNFFHNNANPAYRATVMGGVNNDWRSNTTWSQTFSNFDAISPWMVGRINSLTGSDNYRTTIAAELAYTKSHNQLYMPVIFPGFSFSHQSTANKLNQIPRLGGNFLWRQAYNNLNSGATMLYGAMFDEVNEGTAMYKMAPTADSWPANLDMVPVNADGYTQLPSDWYLKEAGEITKMTRGDIPITQTMTITPH